MNFDEADVISALVRIFGVTHRGVEIGIGDDAAVVSTTDRKSVV
jgi:thiamine-monophosphate kinase